MSVEEIDLAIDRSLSELSGLLPMLRLLTPINVPEARYRFLEGEVEEPEFIYRELPDLGAIAEELSSINPERASDPVLIHMIRGMHRELERRLDMLANRNTEHFLLAAVEKFGHVEKSLLDLAHEILARIVPGPKTTNWVSAPEIAARANRELDHYRLQFPELTSLVHVSETSVGVMVENGDLFIGLDTAIAEDRVDQLIQHEIGVHVLTHVNGSAQPIRMLAHGLAGYEETQEALGVLAEHLSGGLGPRRLRVFAFRVVAAKSVGDGATFRATFDVLVGRGAGRHLAFTTAMRAHRAGGMTKDALYLGGFNRLLSHLRDGGRLDSLMVGKISLGDEPFVLDLLERGVLVDPPLQPRFMESRFAVRRLEEIRAGVTVLELGGLAA